jgi:hypothetical protein
MLKHVGRHGDRKVAIIFREIPGEDHMCLVIYPEVLPTHFHDTIMRVIESPPGQQEHVLANALHRNLLPDGRVILEALHKEGMLKKVPTNQVIVTPTPSSSVKLDELNRLVKEMESGADAAKRMAQLDSSSGMVDPQTKRAAEQQFKREQLAKQQPTQPTLQADSGSALDDRTLAGNMLAQAKRMEAEARGLLGEASRMKKDAERMFPGVNAADAKQADTTSAQPTTTAKKRGRQPKSKVTADAVQ